MYKNVLPAVLLVIVWAAPHAHALEAVVTAVSGSVEIEQQDSGTRTPAQIGNLLEAGDRIHTNAASTAEITLSSGHQIYIKEKTSVTIQKLSAQSTKILQTEGKLRAHVSHLLNNEEFEVKTPAATCSIRGTEFEVEVSREGQTMLKVFTGVVEAREMITGKSVMVGEGQYSSIISGRAPSDPKKFKSKDDGSAVPVSKDERLAEAKKEIFEEISKQQVLEQAVEDMKNAEYQNGKALVDAYGKRVRLEEYIMRPAQDQFKYVVLNERDNRFDFGKILFTFNKTLPNDLNDATQTMFHCDGSAPTWYPTDILSVMSNTTDKVTEIAGGGHPEATLSGNGITYDTVFDQYNFYANDTLLWGYDNTTVPNETTYYGDAAPTSLWLQPDGADTFHFIAKDTYNDGTWIQAEDFIINDEGEVASFSDIIDPDNVNADDIRDRILRLNFERVYTSSLFNGRSIDLVFSSKLLSDAGIIGLPSSLGAPALDTGRLSLDGSHPTGAHAPYALARLRETGDSLPAPVKPYDEERPDELTPSDLRMTHVASCEMMGGQYYVDGDNTSFKGNLDAFYVPVINLSESTALLPIYKGFYAGTKGVEELVGGGTLFQTSMNHALYTKMVHRRPSGTVYKASVGGRGEWLAETEDETLSNGLFNNYRYSLGGGLEKPLNNKVLKLGVDFSYTDYINYQALSSDDRFADAGVTSQMGTDILNFYSSDISAAMVFAFSKQMSLLTEYRASYLMFPDQKVVQLSGEYASSKRHDFMNTINLNGIVDVASARLGLGYGFQYYLSNQNAYDAN
ncbi:MAG: hypothetical protein GF384_07340, partial [Elusimicrobia bacterium]|nr:hypothetical protein [Elusimicrobiota bacterium]MBD3412473.1 hypothetical protein [Elusimicrobiota bacterium]